MAGRLSPSGLPHNDRAKGKAKDGQVNTRTQSGSKLTFASKSYTVVKGESPRRRPRNREVAVVG